MLMLSPCAIEKHFQPKRNLRQTLRIVYIKMGRNSVSVKIKLTNNLSSHSTMLLDHHS